jgi:NADH-quinone oxidoreductase subunit J
MNKLELAYFGLCALMVLVGGISTVAARNPIRGAMGLLGSILGIAGMYLMLSAEFLAAVQLLVYAGAVVVLFIFVIMLLGPSATSGRDARTAIPRYLGAGVFLASAVGALGLLMSAGRGVVTAFPVAPLGFGSIEALGHELFTTELAAFELSGALLLVAVVGAVAVARGKQPDPTLEASATSDAPAARLAEANAAPSRKPAGAPMPVAAKEVHS